MKLGALITTLVLGTSSLAAADVTFHGDVNVGMPTHRAPVRDRQFRSIDTRYDRYYDDRDANVDEGHARHQNRYLRGRTLDGVYQSVLGEVRLQQNGNHISGVYANGGSLEGRIVEDKVFFRWNRRGEQGRGVWLINGRGTLQGMWGMNDSNRDGGRWDLQRTRISRR